ncbi:MAG TPA: DNA-binding protein [Bacteroidetes bacterium]|nr:DNA-binding protein [Bacteroidota bacterium]
MPSITVKNIPAPLYQKIKDRAEAQHRSINSEIIACLEQSTLSNRVSSEEILYQAHQIRQSIKTAIPSDEIQQIIDQGRP